MSSLANDRNTRSQHGEVYRGAVKGGSKLYAGALVMLLAGYLTPAAASAGGVVVGRSERQVDNTLGADGALNADYSIGEFLWNNSAGGDQITAADINQRCFAVDDQTVAKTPGAGRPCAGKVTRIDENGGVWVETRPSTVESRTSRLYYAINETDTLAGTSQELIAPVTGYISLLKTIVQKAVTTGGQVTVKVNGVTVVGLACVVADGAAKGTIYSDTPTANDATVKVAAGDRIEIVPDAAFNTAGAIAGHLEILN